MIDESIIRLYARASGRASATGQGARFALIDD
jgi:hypothetical protein